MKTSYRYDKRLESDHSHCGRGNGTGASAVLRISIGWGRPVYKWPHFHADWTGMDAWGTNRQTLVSLAAAKSPPWCMQRALSVAVISCDVAVSARFTFTHTHIYSHTYAEEPQGCPSCSYYCLHTPWPFLTSQFPLLLLAAYTICCRLISQWSRNCCHLSCRFCVRCVCVHVSVCLWEECVFPFQFVKFSVFSVTAFQWDYQQQQQKQEQLLLLQQLLQLLARFDCAEVGHWLNSFIGSQKLSFAIEIEWKQIQI